MDELRTILSDVFYGKFTHVDPIKALSGLTPELARKKPCTDGRSIWELLFHMAYWQEVVTKAYAGNEEAAKDANDADSWPSIKDMKDDKAWSKLIQRFKNGLEELVRSTKEDNLQKTIDTWANTPLYFNLIVEIAHNSFHLGQIVATRRVLGIWPPE